jgi:hypothetical protein
VLELELEKVYQLLVEHEKLESQQQSATTQKRVKFLPSWFLEEEEDEHIFLETFKLSHNSVNNGVY